MFERTYIRLLPRKTLPPRGTQVLALLPTCCSLVLRWRTQLQLQFRLVPLLSYRRAVVFKALSLSLR